MCTALRHWEQLSKIFSRIRAKPECPWRQRLKPPLPHDAWNLANAESVDIFSKADEWMDSGSSPLRCGPAVSAHQLMIKSENIEICEWRMCLELTYSYSFWVSITKRRNTACMRLTSLLCVAMWNPLTSQWHILLEHSRICRVLGDRLFHP